MVIAVYPGTFDPLDARHEDLVRRRGWLFTNWWWRGRQPRQEAFF